MPHTIGTTSILTVILPGLLLKFKRSQQHSRIRLLKQNPRTWLLLSLTSLLLRRTITTAVTK